MSKGGFVAFRGSSAVAESYLAGKLPKRADATASAAYLAAEKPFQHGAITADGAELGALTREEFRAWAEHIDPVTGETRGAFRTKVSRSIDKDGALVEKVGGTPLYQETLISSSKSLSLAAAAHPEIGVALEAAMERATVKTAEAFHEHAVTRVGPRGRQVQVQFDKIEFTAVQHHTSRTGDPHSHRHVQFLTAGLVTLPSGEQTWRAPDGAVLYRLPERLHAAADLSLSTDVELRGAIAAAGFTWLPGEGGGKVAEFETLADEFSQRRDQVAATRETLEVQWRAEHPGQEPNAKQLRAWDNHGWAATRPEKHELDAEAKFDQDARLAGVVPTNSACVVQRADTTAISAQEIAADALTNLAQQQSAWSRADIKAAIDRRLAETYLIGEQGLADLQAASLAAAETELINFYDEGMNVEGSRHYTSRAVLATDKAIEQSLQRRAQTRAVDGDVEVDRGGFELTEGQAAAGRAIAGTHQLVVVEGAAGSGKTTMLSAANDAILADGRRLVAVSPTKRGAIEMAKEIGTQGNSVHGMLVRAGARFDDRGRWSIPDVWKAQPAEFRMDKDTVLVVDEAGMLDMGTAQALHRYCDDTGVQLVLLGDRKQLAAVGRGGYLTKAVHQATSAHDLQDVQRFKTADKRIDQPYADATLELRERARAAEFFDLLQERGQVQLGEPDEVIDRVAETVALEIKADQTSIAIASTNATVQRINRAVFDRLVAEKIIDGGVMVHGRDGDPIAVGAKVATRLNDRELQVANRQTWIVKRVNHDGRVIVADEQTKLHTTLDAAYVSDNLQLAYAVTAHGSQGMTVDTAHTVLSDQMDAAGTYVGLTRGRHANVLHVVAGDLDEAKEQFEAAVSRQRADEGLDAARGQAQQSLAGLATAAQEPVRVRELQQQGQTINQVMTIDTSFLDAYRTKMTGQPEAAAVGEQVAEMPVADRDQVSTVPAAPAVHEVTQAVQRRSRLRDVVRESPAEQQRVDGLAELEERWQDGLPECDEDRRAFERQVAAVNVGRRTLAIDGVREAMKPELYGLLQQRVEQTEAGNAAGERRAALRQEIDELQEFQRTSDALGVRGTGQRIAWAKADAAFESDYIRQLKADRVAGIYGSREPERQERQATAAAARAQVKPTAVQARVADAKAKISDTYDYRFENQDRDRSQYDASL